MIYYATPSSPAAREAMASGKLRQMLTHKSGNRPVPGARYAIDNGRVVLDDKSRPTTDPAWSETRWRTHLEECSTLAIDWAVVPDIVGDAAATLDLWRRYRPIISALEIPAAFVMQDGAHDVPDDADLGFIGGSDAYKLGPDAARLTSRLLSRGTPVHMGRVNSRRRLSLARDIGCASVDGTYLAYGPDANLPKLLAWLDDANTAPMLWELGLIDTGGRFT